LSSANKTRRGLGVVVKVADGFEPGAVIGPLIDMKAVEKVEAHIADAVKKAPRSSPAASAPRRAAVSSSRRC
jgi:succinate-semialdehyde dehydrogenase/glutarate-semialdehyde dehydrogenase